MTGIVVASDPKSFVGDIEKYRGHYLNNDAILLEDAGFSYDADFLSIIRSPEEMKKAELKTGLTRSAFVFNNGKLTRNEHNILSRVIKNDIAYAKLVSEFREIELQFEQFSSMVFASAFKLAIKLMTFRFCPTLDEGMHFDTFGAGHEARMPPNSRMFKFFLNVDTKPRVWQVGPTIEEFLATMKDRLPKPLPENVNSWLYIVDKTGLLDEFEPKRVEIPPGGMTLANGINVAHQVVAGDRMVCAELGAVATQKASLLSEQEEYAKLVAALDLPVTATTPDLSEYVPMDGAMQRAIKRRSPQP